MRQVRRVAVEGGVRRVAAAGRKEDERQVEAT